MPTPARDRLLDALRGLTPPDTLVLADMTNTLLLQTTDGGGYPDRGRELHREYLARGGALVLVTGDSLAVAREQFLDRLGFAGGDLLLVTGGGHRVDAVRAGPGRVRLRCLHRGRDIPAAAREALLRRVVACVAAEYGEPPADWLSGVRPRLLSTRGTRLDIGPHYPAMGETCYVEVVPNKVTCFFPGSGRSEGTPARALDRIATDPPLVLAAAAEGLHVVRGPNFVDILTHDKGQGLDALAGLPRFARLRPADRTLVVLGDSVNDHPMFGHAGVPCRRRVLVYLGGDDPPPHPGSAGTTFVHLPREHLAGSAFVFEALLAGGTPRR